MRTQVSTPRQRTRGRHHHAQSLHPGSNLAAAPIFEDVMKIYNLATSNTAIGLILTLDINSWIAGCCIQGNTQEAYHNQRHIVALTQDVNATSNTATDSILTLDVNSWIAGMLHSENTKRITTEATFYY